MTMISGTNDTYSLAGLREDLQDKIFLITPK